MENKGVCILVLNEELAYNKFVSEILEKYSYQVLHSGDPSTVLNTIDKIKDRLGLVMTNAYMSEPGEDPVVQYIQNNINLPIALMDHDKSRALPNGGTSSFTAYVINDLRREEIAKLRDLASHNAKGKMVVENQNESTRVQRGTMIIDAIDKKDCSTVSETGSNKRKEHPDKDESGEDESPIQKKGRVHWSPEMHKKFLEAIEIIGRNRAVPKRIVEVMNIPGLTRENVASHLQKHRENMKREMSRGPVYANREIARESLYANKEIDRGSLCVGRANEFKSSPFLPSNSRTCFNASQNSYFAQGIYQMPPYQQKQFVSNVLNRRFLDSHNKFRFMPTTERNSFRNLSNLQSKPRFVPKLQPNRNFRIYTDQTKNVLLNVKGGNAPNQTTNHKFVGLQLTNKGNKIQFGENGFSPIKLTNYDQQNPIREQNNPSTPGLFDPQEPYLLEDIISQFYVSHKTENQVQTPIIPRTEIALEQHALPPFGTYGDESTVSHHLHNDSLKELLMDFEHETFDTPSALVPDEDLMSPWLELLNNNTSMSFEGGSEQHFSQPRESNGFVEATGVRTQN